MQIFQPCEHWKDCAEYLRRDPKRLGKQAVELYQIYMAVDALLHDRRHGYINHPIVRHIYHNGRPYDLFSYFDELTRVWMELGYRRSDAFLENVSRLRTKIQPYFTDEPYQPFFCAGTERSYVDVEQQYRRLLETKWAGQEKHNKE